MVYRELTVQSLVRTASLEPMARFQVRTTLTPRTVFPVPMVPPHSLASLAHHRLQVPMADTLLLQAMAHLLRTATPPSSTVVPMARLVILVCLPRPLTVRLTVRHRPCHMAFLLTVRPTELPRPSRTVPTQARLPLPMAMVPLTAAVT